MAAARPSRPQAAHMPNEILVVDDHTLTRVAVRIFLEQNGFDVCGEASGGLEAIEKARELAPAIVLLDVYLLFMDELRANLLWVVLAFLSCSAGLMIWAPRMQKGWRRVVVRTIGSVLLGLIVLVSPLYAFFASVDPPREHTWFKSKTGTRIALLSHSEFRDASATQVTVKGDSYWQRYVAYDYFGDGDDYIGPTSVKWLDDHHLAITYALDPSGVQQCHSQAGDVQVICDPQPAPSFSSGSNQR